MKCKTPIEIIDEVDELEDLRNQASILEEEIRYLQKKTRTDLHSGMMKEPISILAQRFFVLQMMILKRDPAYSELNQGQRAQQIIKLMPNFGISPKSEATIREWDVASLNEKYGFQTKPTDEVSDSIRKKPVEQLG